MNELSRRYLYIDETGTPYLNDKRCPFFILIGVSINGFSNTSPLYYLDNIFAKHNIDYKQNFHTVDLFEPIKDKDGKLHPTYIKEDKKARELMIEIANFINIFPMYISGCLIKKRGFGSKLHITKTKLNKSSIPKHFKRDLSFLPYTYSMTKLIHDFANYKPQFDCREKIGSVIFETRPENELIIKNIERIINPLSFDNKKIQEKAQKTKENIASIEFSNKNACYPGLALADIIGFALHQHYAKKVTKFKKRGLSELLKSIDKQKSSIEINQSKILKNLNKHLTKETLNKISKIS